MIPAADAAVSALQAIAELERDFVAAADATSAAAASASSAFLAAEAGHGALSSARFRRTERLLEAVRRTVDAARSTVRRAQEGLHSGPSERRECKDATWCSFSDDWWEEKCVGLRWRLGALGDALQDVRGVTASEQAGDVSCYSFYVRAVHENVLKGQALLVALKEWTKEWSALALLSKSGLVGEPDVYCGKE